MAQLKFQRGLLENLKNLAITDGQLIVTTDEGAIYLDNGSNRVRLGDFIVVANVAALPEAGANTKAMYYCENENVLARWDGSEWIQINKQPTSEEMKTALGLKAMAYKAIVSESDLDTALAEKVNAASEGNHSHLNKSVLDGITAEDIAVWDKAGTAVQTVEDGTTAGTIKVDGTDVKVAGFDTVAGKADSAVSTSSANTTEIANIKTTIGDMAGNNLTEDIATELSMLFAETDNLRNTQLPKKADKVTGATAGNFAGLDANGNLTDSGKKAADFATAAQGAKADSAVQSITVLGSELTNGSELSTSTAKAALGLNASDIMAYEKKANYETAANAAATKSALEGSIATKAAQADLEALQGVVGGKADSSVVEGIGGRLTTAEGEIDTLQAGIATKAENSVVEGINGRLTTAEGEIDDLQSRIEGLTGAMHFVGAVDSIPEDVSGYKSGDVVVTPDHKEYVFDGEKFIELGDEGSYLTKTEASSTYATKDALSTGLAGKVDQSAYDTATQSLANGVSQAIQAASTAETNAKGYTDEKIGELGISNYLKKSEAVGYNDILTKTDAATLYSAVDHDHDDDYDAKGAAAAVQGDTDATVASVKASAAAAQTRADNAYALAEGRATMDQVNSAISAAGHAAASDLNNHIGDTVAHITAAERTAWNAAEGNAKAYADGLAGNYDASGAAATAESNAKAYAKEYADGLAGNYDASGSAAVAESNAKSYTDTALTWGEF